MSDVWFGASVAHKRPVERGLALAQEALAIRRYEQGDPNVIIFGTNLLIDCFAAEAKHPGFVYDPATQFSSAAE